MAEDSEMMQIEIQGVKMEVDLRHAKRIEHLRVGDRVKLLHKRDHYEPTVRPGVIIGFEPFETLPTIVVAYLKVEFDKAELAFAYINAKNKNFELVKSIDDDGKALDREEAIAGFNRQIDKKRAEMQELEERRDYFERKFATYWEPVQPVVAGDTSTGDTQSH